MKKILSVAFVLLLAASAMAATRDTRSRILWDRSSFKEICNGVYARIKELPNGKWLMVSSAGRNIITSESDDKGESWSDAKTVTSAPAYLYYTNAEALVLKNGKIILGWNERVDNGAPEDKVFSISCQISENNGKTWGNPIRIHTGLHDWGNGCWEPSFLEMPNGDLHCYFANEGPFTQGNDQEISVCISKDGGLTWSASKTVSYRSGCRDGMPVPVILEDSATIAVAIEDNGTRFGGGFKPTIVRTTIDDPWPTAVTGNSLNRNCCFTTMPYEASAGGGAPYLVVLPTGETVVSWQCTAGRGKEDMFVAVGTNDARDFKHMTQPFNTALNTTCLWNSLTVMSDSTLIACGSQGNSIVMLKGKTINKWQASYCPIYIDGIWNKKTEHWFTSTATQAIGGNSMKGRWVVDLAYSKHYLNIYAKVTDVTLVSDKKTHNDGMRVLLDLQDLCTEMPTAGQYNITCEINGNIIVKKGNSDSWSEDASLQKGIWTKTTESSTGYVMEIAIPWTLLGVTDLNAVKGGISFERIDRTSDDYIEDPIPGCGRYYPYSWLPLELGPMPTDVKDSDDIFDYDTVLTALPVVYEKQMLNSKCYNLMGQPVSPDTKGIIVTKDGKYLNR